MEFLITTFIKELKILEAPEAPQILILTASVLVVHVPVLHRPMHIYRVPMVIKLLKITSARMCAPVEQGSILAGFGWHGEVI